MKRATRAGRQLARAQEVIVQDLVATDTSLTLSEVLPHSPGLEHSALPHDLRHWSL